MTKLSQATKRYAKAQADLEEAREALSDAIWEAQGQNQSLRSIAAEVGLSFGRIHQILAKRL